MQKRLILIGTVLLLLAGSMAYAQDEIIDMYRSDLRAEKIALIAEEMEFTEAEASAFWPVYRKYERELRKINDARLELIKMYADEYFEIDDAMARHLITKSNQLKIKEAYLKKEYFRKFDHILPTTKVAKFYQLENIIDLLVKVQIAAELPFIE